MATAWELLRLLIKTHAILSGTFELKGGNTSTTYVDLRQITLSGEGVGLVGTVMAHLISRQRYDVVGGPAVGAIPIATALQMTHAMSDPRPDTCIIRSEPKGHGLQRQIEGPSIAGRRVALVEDTTTTGGSVVRCIEAVRKAGGIVDCVAVIVDRMAGARETIEAMGLPFLAAYNLADLGLAAPDPL